MFFYSASAILPPAARYLPLPPYLSLSGESVDGLQDLSLNSWALTKVADVSRPTYSNYVLGFSGSQYLVSSDATFTPPYTVKVLFSPASVTTTMSLLDSYVSGRGQIYLVNDRLWLNHGLAVEITGASLARSTQYCIVMSVSANDTMLFLDGALVYRGDSGAQAMGGLVLGANKVLGAGWQGSVYGLTLYEGNVSEYLI